MTSSPRPDVPAPPDPAVGVGELRAFVAVARAGTVGEAARLLGRTQPSVSARLATLESAWGTRLFRRGARGMELTPEGGRLLPRAESALAALEALDRTAGLPVAERGTLRVGAGDALGRVLLPRALGRVARRRPGLEVYLREGPGPALFDALREGEIDLALAIRPREGSEEGLDLEPWIESPVELLVPRGHGLAERSRPSLQDLDGEPLVALQRGSAFRRHLEDAFAAAGVRFRPAVEVGNLSLVRRFVIAGLGVAPVPAVAFSSSPSAGVVRLALRGVSPVAYVRAVRRGAPLPGPVIDLLEHLKNG